MPVADCEFRHHHAELQAQLETVADRLVRVEEHLDGRAESRVADLHDFTEKVSEVHEKLNSVAIKVAALEGRIAVAGAVAALLGTVGGGLVLFLLQQAGGR